MSHPIVQVANPLSRRGGYALPHVLLIAVALLIAFLAGALTERHFDAAYFQAHNPNFIHLAGSEFHALPVADTLTPPPPTGSINLTWLPVPGNQDGVGACVPETFTHNLGFLVSRLIHIHEAFSARWFYDLADQGLGRGTRPEQMVAITNARGAMRHHYYDYPPYALTATPPNFPVEHHPTWDEFLWIGHGAGVAGVNQAKARIAAGRPIELGMEAYDNIYNAATTGHYDLPGPGNVHLGGHDTLLIAYDDTHCFNGVCGWFLAQQTWGRDFGVGKDGTFKPYGHDGYYWISYRFVAQYGDQADVVHLGVHSNTYGLPAASKPFRYYPSHAPLHQAPVKVGPPGLTAGSSRPQVYNVRTADTGVDLSRAINDSANFYGFSAPGFAALMGVESGIRQYAPHTPIYGAGGCDYSAGLTQITVCTAAGLGVGDGTLSQSNINYVFWYEQVDPIRDVWMSARLVAQFRDAVGFDFRILYSAWNLGAGYGRYNDIYVHPTNYITIRAVASYDSWWNLIWSRNVTYAPPPAPPAPRHRNTHRYSRASWCRSARSHHLRCPSAFYGHHLGVVPFQWIHWQHAFHGRRSLNSVCGGVISQESWDARNQIMWQRYAHCGAWSWPHQHGDPTKWKHLPTWKRKP